MTTHIIALIVSIHYSDQKLHNATHHCIFMFAIHMYYIWSLFAFHYNTMDLTYINVQSHLYYLKCLFTFHLHHSHLIWIVSTSYAYANSVITHNMFTLKLHYIFIICHDNHVTFHKARIRCVMHMSYITMHLQYMITNENSNCLD